MANENLYTSPSGLSFIAKEEGTVLHIYKDVVGYETIGIGHLLTPSDKASGIFNNGITLQQALDLLAKDIKRFEDAIKKYITVDLNQNQFDAICSMIFNTGSAPIITGGLGKVLNANNFAAAPSEMLKWCKAGGTTNQGLLNRRKAEVALFLKPMDNELSDDQKQQILNMVDLTSQMSVDDLFEQDHSTRMDNS